MIPLMTIAGLTASIGGTAASAIGSRDANKAQEQAIRDEQARRRAYFTQQAMQDPTLRSDNASMLRLFKDELEDQTKSAEAKAKITGATQETEVAGKEAAASGLSAAIQQMSAGASARRDKFEGMREQSEEQAEAQLANVKAERMQNWANLAKNAASLGDLTLQTFASGKFPDLNKKKKDNNSVI